MRQLMPVWLLIVYVRFAVFRSRLW